MPVVHCLARSMARMGCSETNDDAGRIIYSPSSIALAHDFTADSEISRALKEIPVVAGAIQSAIAIAQKSVIAGSHRGTETATRR